MKSQLKNAQRGYSLIELSIALAIIGVVIAGAIIGVQSILRTNNVNKTISQTNNAVNRIVAKLARDNTYNNATTATLTAANQGIWEDNYLGAVGVVNHPFGNDIFVTPLGGAGQFDISAGQAYSYALTGIPVAACTDLAVGLEGLAVGVSIVNQAAPTAAAVNALNGIIPAGGLVKSPGNAYSTALATTACSGATQSATIYLSIPRR